MIKRISTLTFARRALPHLDNGAKLAEALDLALAADILHKPISRNSAP